VVLAGSNTFADVIPVTLGTLIADHGSITIGDKTFSNFAFASTDLSTDANDLEVSASIENGIYYLDWSGPIDVNNLTGTSPEQGDVKLSYTVTADPGSIVMIDQDYTPNALPVPGNQIIIGETVKNDAGVIVGNSTLTLTPTDLSDPAPEAGDNLILAGGPYQQLSVVKDITIYAAADQAVGLSDVEQSFHQEIPEPSTWALLLGGVGLLGFMVLRRNRGDLV
jgi:PEP-CTERM motif